MESRRTADHALTGATMFKPLCLAGALLALATPTLGQTTFTVALRPLADEKAVFATVESQNVVPARARIGGTILELTARDGDEVSQGQRIALVGDDKLRLQMHSLDAQIEGLKSQLAQARVDFTRSDTLARTGAVSRQQLDQTRTAVDVATSALASRSAERAVVAQQIAEGAVLAPIAGRVLQVPLTTGSVVLPGDAVAQVAESDFVLRLSVPERHARFLHVGDRVRLDGADFGTSGDLFATVTLVYPRIQDGRVLADATAANIGKYFAGQRVRVWVAADERPSFVIPGHLVASRFGLDYVMRRGDDGTASAIPIQRGRDAPSADMADGVEILSGLRAGDVLVAP
jgi:RND family efflux transporter MFP subunit